MARRQSHNLDHKLSQNDLVEMSRCDTMKRVKRVFVDSELSQK